MVGFGFQILNMDWIELAFSHSNPIQPDLCSGLVGWWMGPTGVCEREKRVEYGSHRCVREEKCEWSVGPMGVWERKKKSGVWQKEPTVTYKRIFEVKKRKKR